MRSTPRNLLRSFPVSMLLCIVLINLLNGVSEAAPLIRIEFPENSKAYDSTTIDVNWSIEDPAGGNVTSEYSLDLGPFISTGSNTSIRLENLTDGFHDLSVRCRNDLAEEAESSISFMIDTHDPSVEFTQEGTLFTNLDPVLVEWSSLDNGSGVDRVETRLDEEQWQDKGNVNGQIVTLETEGRHFFQVAVYDKAGNRASISREIVLDREKPQLEVLSPIDGDTINTSRIEVVWGGSDDQSGISSYEVQLDSTAANIFDAPGSYEYRNIADGRHEIRVNAFDMAGNIRSITVTVEVDTFQPYVVQFYPQGTDVSIDEKIWVATSEMLVLGTVEFSVTGLEGNITVNGGQIGLEFNGSLEYGKNYFVTLSGSDRAGNRIRSFTWNFTTTDTG